MLRNWLEPQELTVPEEFSRIIGGNPLVSQVLYSRGLTDIEAARGFLYSEDYHPSPPTALPDLEKAVTIIHKALSAKKRIGIWGDFDVDGQTSTTILVSALQEMGGNVVFHIPVRGEESHGISLPALKDFLKHGVDLIVTCDTGVSSSEAIEFAKTRGVPVVITDHHDLPDELPDAEAIVNPKNLPPAHPLSTLPGVGVAYKLVEELWHREREDEKPHQYLDLVALGIVADIALLKGDTRYLLQIGLEALRHTRRSGILAIMELSELNQSNVTEEHIGFFLAPRMNALGRLDDANSMVELLTTENMGRARTLALQLEGINAQRKLLSDQVFQAAQAQLTVDPKLLEYPVLVLSHPAWPAGVIGIVASRLMEQYHRPVILFSAPVGETAHGSARSIEGVNITNVIASNRNLVKEFGGHPMAAGLSLDSDNIADFRSAVSRTVLEMGIGLQKEKDLSIDGYISLPELTLDLVEDLERLAPFGAGNPALVFDTRNLRLTGYAAVGRAGEHLQLTIEDDLGHTRQSIWWQGAGFSLPEANFDLAYSVRASTYRGQRDVQIEWIDYRLAESQSIAGEKTKRTIEVIDQRTKPELLTRLNQLREHENLVVWGEATAKSDLDCLDRFSLHPAESLAIWTIPPGTAEIQAALEKVQPSRVHLFAVDPEMDEPSVFLKRLAGLVKHILSASNGSGSLNALAAATAQRVLTVKAGLEWLDGSDYIHLISVKGDEVQLKATANQKKYGASTESHRLNSLLAESAAFRRYYLTANKDRLVMIDKET
jgi:single-stranded-DNA-specific exonuclease